METVGLAWAWTGGDIDGGLMDARGRCYHFSGLLRTLHGPNMEITVWDALSPSDAREIYGDLVDAGLELIRRAQAD
jgi:hypothetical protein